MPEGGVPVIRRVTTAELAPAEIADIRAILSAAFVTVDGGMTEDDWTHSIGGVHVVLEVNGIVLAHASVVPRELHLGGQPLRSGYVEAVAVAPERQRQGFGTLVMAEVADVVRNGYELGALATGTPEFYERLGWQRWLGPTSVRTSAGNLRTPEDDGWILVRETPATPIPLDLRASISCDWRVGDVW
jgi:aminoglycoside 2'-N-acetyltransferase I